MESSYLTKCSITDICVIIIFQKKHNFPVTARDLIFYLKHTAVWTLQKQSCGGVM